MLELQKIFLLVRFFNWISCNKGLKAKISQKPPLGRNVLEAERLFHSWRHIGLRNTKTCIHGASQMERKCGKCWRLQIFEGKLRVFISYLSEVKTARSITLLYSSTFTACFYHFLFWRYLNSSMTRFSSDILLPFPNSNDLNSHG